LFIHHFRVKRIGKTASVQSSPCWPCTGYSTIDETIDKFIPNRSIQLTAEQPQFRTAEEEADVARIDLRGNARF
jgi:hypothetical protein